MLSDIQSFDLLFGGNPETDGVLDSEEDHHAEPERPSEGGSNTDGLGDQLADTVAGEEPVVGGEQADCQGAPGTTDAVDGNGTDRIVNANLVEEHAGEDNNESGDQTGNRGIHRVRGSHNRR